MTDRTDRARHAAFTREMDRLEREFAAKPDKALPRSNARGWTPQSDFSPPDWAGGGAPMTEDQSARIRAGEAARNEVPVGLGFFDPTARALRRGARVAFSAATGAPLPAGTAENVSDASEEIPRAIGGFLRGIDSSNLLSNEPWHVSPEERRRRRLVAQGEAEFADQRHWDEMGLGGTPIDEFVVTAPRLSLPERVLAKAGRVAQAAYDLPGQIWTGTEAHARQDTADRLYLNDRERAARAAGDEDLAEQYDRASESVTGSDAVNTAFGAAEMIPGWGLAYAAPSVARFSARQVFRAAAPRTEIPGLLRAPGTAAELSGRPVAEGPPRPFADAPEPSPAPNPAPPEGAMQEMQPQGIFARAPAQQAPRTTPEVNANQAHSGNATGTEADLWAGLPTSLTRLTPAQYAEIAERHPWFKNRGAPNPARIDLIRLSSARGPDGAFLYDDDVIGMFTGITSRDSMKSMRNQARHAGVSVPMRLRGPGGATVRPGGEQFHRALDAMERAERNGRYLSPGDLAVALGVKPKQAYSLLSQIRSRARGPNDWAWRTRGGGLSEDLLDRFRRVDAAQRNRAGGQHPGPRPRAPDASTVAALGATGAGGAYLLGADEADASNGENGDSFDWLGAAGAGATSAAALYGLYRGGRFLGASLARRARPPTPTPPRAPAAPSVTMADIERANVAAGRDANASTIDLPPLPARQRGRLRVAARESPEAMIAAFASSNKLKGEALARLAESMGVAVVRRGARLDRNATARNILYAAHETNAAGRPTINATARRARLREMGLFASPEVGAVDIPPRAGARSAPGEIRANASPPPGPRAAGTAEDVQPNAIGGIRGYHGSPHDFAAERLVRMADGTEKYIVGVPDALPEIPVGAHTIRDYPLGRFREDKIGSGEGAQAYGYGPAYIAENEAVARGYRDALTAKRRVVEVDGKEWTDPSPGQLATYFLYDAHGDAERALLQAQNIIDRSRRAAVSTGWTDASITERGPSITQHAADALKTLLGRRVEIPKPPGRMYEVNINAEPGDFLDWDAPLAAQPNGVRDALVRQGLSLEQYSMPVFQGGKELPRVSDGSTVFRALTRATGGYDGASLESTQGASHALRDAGIPGIRYLDQGSRAAGEGSRNYVVFDDSLIEILRKYGIAGLGVTGAGAAALGAQDAQAADGGEAEGGISPEILAALGGAAGLGALAAGRLRSGFTGPTLRDMARLPNGIIDTAARGGIRSDIDPRLILGAGAATSALAAPVSADMLSDYLGADAQAGEAEARTGALREAVSRMNDAPQDQPWNYENDAPSMLPEPTPQERRQAIARILSNTRGLTMADITEADIRREADIIRRARMGLVTGRGEPGDAVIAEMR